MFIAAATVIPNDETAIVKKRNLCFAGDMILPPSHPACPGSIGRWLI
jgi:hypothetical protein